VKAPDKIQLLSVVLVAFTGGIGFDAIFNATGYALGEGPEMVVDRMASVMNGGGYAAAFARRARFQFQGRSSSIRLAG
jgi:hypothetical protein